MIYRRKLNLKTLLKEKSFFLFGPRSTGKSTLIRNTLPDAVYYDLLDARTYSRLLRSPHLIEEENQNSKRVIVIDEIQKMPSLLDEVHRCIELQKMRFLLTGSSARKLKHGAANLLAGRAWQASLFPLVSSEIENFDLLKYLNQGGLPQVYNSKNYAEELENYVALYLQEEVKAEASLRNISAFSQFLDLLALSNGEELSYDSFSRDCGVSSKTIRSYIEIMEDTLLGYQLPAYVKTKKRKAISRSKFYLFDLGVVNTLANRGEIKKKSELFGKAFEHFIVNEVRAYLGYERKKTNMFYWRSTSQFEVDLIIGNELALEIKASEQVNDKHLKGLRALKEEGGIKKYMVVSLDPKKRTLNDNIEILPYETFIKSLWTGKLF